MAVTYSTMAEITAAEFGVLIGKNSNPDQLPEDSNGNETRMLFDSVRTIVDARTVVDTPHGIRNQALVTLGAYILQRPTAPGYTSHANAWINSGAALLLSDYIKRPIVPLGGDDVAV